MSNNLSFENILIEKMSNNLSDGNFPGGRLQFMGGTEKKCVGESGWHGLNFQYFYLYSVFAGCVNQLKLETLEKTDQHFILLSDGSVTPDQIATFYESRIFLVQVL